MGDKTGIATDLAYLAGVIDSDGYVTASRTVRNGAIDCAAQIGITGSRRAPHDLAASLFGGNVTVHSPGRDRSHYRPQFHWQVAGTKAVAIIIALLPYLRVKRERALLVLDLQEVVDGARACRLEGFGSYPWAAANFAPNVMFDSMVEEIRHAS